MDIDTLVFFSDELEKIAEKSSFTDGLKEYWRTVSGKDVKELSDELLKQKADNILRPGSGRFNRYRDDTLNQLIEKRNVARRNLGIGIAGAGLAAGGIYALAKGSKKKEGKNKQVGAF
jgi:hypothetical protein